MNEQNCINLIRSFTAMAVAVAVATVAGCGEPRPDLGVKTYPVQGKVVLGSGTPLTSGVVVFVSESEKSHSVAGTVGTDGTFTVMTDGVAAGAPAGDYKVRVEIDPDAPVMKKQAGLPFPAKYNKESSSGLTATVKAEPANELPPFVLR